MYGGHKREDDGRVISVKNSSACKQQNNNPFRNFETNSSLSKGSSNNTPNRFSNINSSLKKVKSVSHFNNNNTSKASNYKDGRSTSTHKINEKSPIQGKHLSNSSSNLNLNLDSRLNLTTTNNN